MYRYASQTRMNVTNTRLRQRILAAVIGLLLVIAVTASVTAISAVSFRNQTQTQFFQRISSCASSAVEQVNRMESTTNSSTAQKIGIVRQYVYTIEQLNAMSISLYGETGRYAPQEAFTALYSDLDAYDGLVQSAKNSTLDVRALLLNHLIALQAYVRGEITS